MDPDIEREFARPLDLKAWKRELAFIKRRARMLAGNVDPGARRTWTRDELYDRPYGSQRVERDGDTA